VFDLSIPKLLALAVIALIVFGPNELPKIASQAGKFLRDLRRIAEGAKADLREGLGPEFQDFDFDDLNPRRFVQKHLLEDGNGNGNGAQALFDDLKSTSATISRGLNDALNGEPAAATAAAGMAATTAQAGMAAQGGANGATATRGVLSEGEEPPFDLEAT
jgi:sec-independent protein translocase protein TatB